MAGVGEFEQLVLLAVLRLGEEAAYGVKIRQAIEEGTGRDIAAGAVYTTLARLENRGLVGSRAGESTPERSGNRRKYYEVLPAGAAALYRAYAAVQSMARGLEPQLVDLAAQANGPSR